MRFSESEGHETWRNAKKFFRFLDRLPYLPFYRTIVLNVKVKDHMILKFNLSFLRKNKNFEIVTCCFRAYYLLKIIFQTTNKQISDVISHLAKKFGG